MLVKVKNIESGDTGSREFEVPFDPMVIKLSDYVEYQKVYGNNLDAELSEIVGDESLTETEKMDAIENHVDNEALAWFSFWTKLDLYEAAEQASIVPLINAYRSLRVLFRVAEDTAEQKFPYSISWLGEEWEIQDFAVNPISNMSFHEIVISKEIVRQAYSIGEDEESVKTNGSKANGVKKKQSGNGGKWTAMPYLCAVFLRKKGEGFRDDLVYEGGERMRLMQELPLQYALHIGFFLKSCVAFLRTHLASLNHPEEVIQNQN